MYSIAQHSVRDRFDGAEGFYDFLAWYAFTLMAEHNIPGVLLPSGVIDLLNAPAVSEDIPLTIGMLLYLKAKHSEQCTKIRTNDRELLLALSFIALQGILSCGHTRLIPQPVSRFWRSRPMKLVTAFEYVAAQPMNGIGEGDTPALAAADEKKLRGWYHQEVSGSFRGARLMTGPPDSDDDQEALQPLVDSAVVIYRDHDTVCGLSRAGISLRDALVESSMPTFDLHFSLGRHRLDSEKERNETVWINARRRLHIINVNPERVPECCYANAPRIWPSDYLIGQFYWELSHISRIHEVGIGLVDEIWTASQYLTDIYSRDRNKPVFTMGQAVVAKPPASPFDRKEFGFANDAYLFLFSFDVWSIVERKNPLGTIMAFQRAFPKGTESVGLVIKTRNIDGFQTDRDRLHWARAHELIRQDPRIRVIDYTLTEEAVSALYVMCDCFVSLHRSEGFGFGPAEAMAQSRPAIVTNYSGVCDFCTPATAKLVAYQLIPVKHDEYPYMDGDRTYQWADPDLKMAAEYMRELAEDRGQSRRLGSAGRELISREYSLAALRQRYIERLRQLGFVEAAICQNAIRC
jgi:glycosyltransferase involved in cell wall biosynthesis